MSLLTVAKEKLINHWLEATVVFLSSLLASAYWLLEPRLLSLAASLPTVWLLRTGLAMLLVALGSVAYALYLHPRLEFLPKYGVYRDRKTDIFYCPSCRTARRLRSPLIERDDGWLCVVRDCHAHYENRPMASEYRREASGLRDRVKELERKVADYETPKGPHGGFVVRK